jgi:hypothetical protein
MPAKGSIESIFIERHIIDFVSLYINRLSTLLLMTNATPQIHCSARTLKEIGVPPKSIGYGDSETDQFFAGTATSFSSTERSISCL